MQIDEVNTPDNKTGNDLFYNFPTYNAIDFEIQCILKLLNNLSNI
jgi:hypothetical protein